ncbi:MAG: hypothetical protein H7A25_21325 [Leptospiraceae bacterium]|nr:hypothetical protein [Leptospiraceae bacterium]
MSSSFLTPSYSILISILAGLGFIAILAIAPVSESKRPSSLFRTKPQDKVKEKRESFSPELELEKKDTESKNFLNLVPIPSHSPIQYLETDKVYFGFTPQLSEKSLSDSLFTSYIPDQNGMFFIYQKRGFEAKAILSSNTKKDIIYTEKWKALQNPAYRAMNQTPHTPVDKNLNALEFSYEIRPGISAVLRSSYMDTENKGENPRLMMAGVNLGKNKFISTQFYAGDANGGISYLYSGILAYDSMLYGQTNSNPTDSKKRLFEWQTSIHAGKHLGLQTSVYNVKEPDKGISKNEEGARVSMFIGLDYFTLNLKYNYMSNDLLQSIHSGNQYTGGSDFAALGFTFFMGKYKQYSLYLGNNYHNLVTGTLSQADPRQWQDGVSPVTNSFTAVFKGRATEIDNATIFLYFRNQSYKNLLYSNLGNIRLPGIQENNEYSTSLGLEMFF